MRQLLAVNFAIFLAACSSELKQVPTVDFSNKPPLFFNVATVEFIPAFAPIFEDKFRKTRSYPEFASAIQNWSQHNFINRGTTGALIVTIEQADIKESSIPKKHQGLKGVFTYDPSEKYEGNLAVRLEIKDENGFTKESTLTSTSHTITVLENITLAKRDQKIADLMHTLIEELDSRLRDNVNENLTDHLLR